MVKKTLIERKVKALEEYLGIVFEPDEDDKDPYDSYHEKDYSPIKRLNDKVNKKKRHFKVFGY